MTGTERGRRLPSPLLLRQDRHSHIYPLFIVLTPITIRIVGSTWTQEEMRIVSVVRDAKRMNCGYPGIDQGRLSLAKRRRSCYKRDVADGRIAAECCVEICCHDTTGEEPSLERASPMVWYIQNYFIE